MTRPAYDVDLDAWRNKFAFHPADTTVKQLGHQLARKAVMALAELLHWLIPPSDDKSTAFRLLGDVLMYANRALATGGGPVVLGGDAPYTEQVLNAALKTYEGTALPEDPRIREYEADQRRVTGMIERDGKLEEVYFDTTDPRAAGLPGLRFDAPTQTLGFTGGVMQEALEEGGVPDTALADDGPETFRHEIEDGDVTLKIVGGRGYVAIAVTAPTYPPQSDEDGSYGWCANLSTPFGINQVLSAIATAGDRAFTV